MFSGLGTMPELLFEAKSFIYHVPKPIQVPTNTSDVFCSCMLCDYSICAFYVFDPCALCIYSMYVFQPYKSTQLNTQPSKKAKTLEGQISITRHACGCQAKRRACALPQSLENCGCAHTPEEGRTTSPPFVRMCAQPQFSENRGSAHSILRVCALLKSLEIPTARTKKKKYK